jgi:hypothetical protein
MYGQKSFGYKMQQLDNIVVVVVSSFLRHLPSHWPHHYVAQFS